MASIQTTGDDLLLPCASCGQRNRVHLGRLLEVAKCGECGAALPPPGAPIALGDGTLPAFVAASPLPVVLDCWAAWCAPCRKFAPTFDAWAAANAGRVLAAKLDTQSNPETARRLGIQAIPTIIVFDEGRELTRTSGAPTAVQLSRLVFS